MSETLHYERGRRIMSWREVLNRHAQLVNQPGFQPPRRWYHIHRWFTPEEPLVPRTFDGPAFEWGGLALPIDEARCHSLVLGATGSGKSLLLGAAAVGIHAEIRRNPDARAVYYDRKGELLARFMAMSAEPVLIDPFDKRGVGIDFARDATTPSDFQQMAAALIPTAHGKEETFWINAPRSILSAVLENLAHFNPGTWSLGEALRIMHSADRIAEMLGRRLETAEVWNSLRGDAKTEANLMASIVSLLKRFEVVAALWERSSKQLSIREWATRGNGMLLLRSHPNRSEVLEPIYRLILNTLADETLSLPDSTTRRTFVVLDEARSLGRIPTLYALVNEGRSKGVCVTLGSQSIEGLQEVYGEKAAAEILGQLRTKIFLRCDSAHTAKWIEDHIGQVQYLVESVSTNTSRSSGGSPGGSSYTSGSTRAISRRRESLILASEVMKLPPPVPGGVFSLICDVPSLGGIYLGRYLFEDLISRLPASDPKVKSFSPRPKSDQILLAARPEAVEERKAPSRRRLRPTVPPPTAPKSTATADTLLNELERLEREDRSRNEPPKA